jgi:hypothetical protein
MDIWPIFLGSPTRLIAFAVAFEKIRLTISLENWPNSLSVKHLRFGMGKS